MIRTVLWRRDKTVVPRGDFFSFTPKDFSQSWDFEDFPVLRPNGFIRSMGSFRPIGLTAPHPGCAFEVNSWPADVDYEEWENWLAKAMQGGKGVSYTGIHKPKESRRPAA